MFEFVQQFHIRLMVEGMYPLFQVEEFLGNIGQGGEGDFVGGGGYGT